MGRSGAWYERTPPPRRGALRTLQKAGLIGVQIIVAIARGPMLGGQIDTQLSMVRLGGGEMGSYAEAGSAYVNVWPH